MISDRKRLTNALDALQAAGYDTAAGDDECRCCDKSMRGDPSRGMGKAWWEFDDNRWAFGGRPEDTHCRKLTSYLRIFWSGDPAVVEAALRAQGFACRQMFDEPFTRLGGGLPSGALLVGTPDMAADMDDRILHINMYEGPDDFEHRECVTYLDAGGDGWPTGHVTVQARSMGSMARPGSRRFCWSTTGLKGQGGAEGFAWSEAEMRGGIAALFGERGWPVPEELDPAGCGHNQPTERSRRSGSMPAN